MIFPVFTSPELLSTALHQTLVLKNVKEVSGKRRKSLSIHLQHVFKIFQLDSESDYIKPKIFFRPPVTYHILSLSEDSEKSVMPLLNVNV